MDACVPIEQSFPSQPRIIPYPSQLTDLTRLWLMRLPTVLLCLHIKAYDLSMDGMLYSPLRTCVSRCSTSTSLNIEVVEIVDRTLLRVWPSSENTFYDFVCADIALALTVLASLPRGTRKDEELCKTKARALCDAFNGIIPEGRIVPFSRVFHRDPLSAMFRPVECIPKSLEQLMQSGRINEAAANQVLRYIPTKWHVTHMRVILKPVDFEFARYNSRVNWKLYLLRNSTFFPSSTSFKQINLFDDMHADFWDTSEQLGLEPNEMCEYLDRAYDITPDNVSLPGDWQTRCTDSGLSSRLMRAYSRQPDLFPRLAERLAQDLTQLLSQPWPNLDHPIEAVSARSIMRIIVLCAIIVHVCGDTTCIQCLGLVFPQLLIVPCTGLPSLQSELLRYNTVPPSPEITESARDLVDLAR